MNINPYVFYQGRAEEAIEFYKAKLGAKETMLMRFKDGPPPSEDQQCGPDGAPAPPIDPEKIMHAEITIGESTVLISDGRCDQPTKFEGFSLALYAKDDDEAKKLYDALSSDGGVPFMPLISTFFATSFGMLSDKFGVNWMVLCLAKMG